MDSFISHYNKVDLKKYSAIKFPNICIVCGQVCQDEETSVFGSFGEIFGHWKSIIKGRPRISMPTHYRCKKILKKKSLRRENIGLLMYGSPTGIYLYFHRALDIWSVLFFAFSVFLSGLILDRFYYQMPVEFTVYNDKISFMFKDKEYATKFALLNEEALYENRILKNFGQNKENEVKPTIDS